MTLPKSPRRDPSSYKRLTSKPLEQGKPRKPMRVRGASTRSKQVAAWHKELHAEWQLKGINHCEFGYDKCMRTFGLALAHSKKRRFITDKEAYWEVGLACQVCHDELDLRMTHEEMEAEVKRIIRERDDRNE